MRERTVLLSVVRRTEAGRRRPGGPRLRNSSTSALGVDDRRRALLELGILPTLELDPSHPNRTLVVGIIMSMNSWSDGLAFSRVPAACAIPESASERPSVP